MCLPVAGVDICVLDGIATVDHHTASDVDTHMAHAVRVIGALEENQITGLGGGAGNRGTDVIQPCRSQPSHVPAHATVIDYP